MKLAAGAEGENVASALQTPELPLRFYAKIHGEPLHTLPVDLYIPPEALEVFLDTFEGPLDLLLYLVRRANLNILDIPMAPLTAQYLAYIEAMQQQNLALAGDYLLMAAMLLEIKSRLLLPKPPAESDVEPAEDPRAELVRRLLEYEQIRAAAQRLDKIPRVERDYEWAAVHLAMVTVERLPTVSLGDLQMAWVGLLRRAALYQHHAIARETLSVRAYMSEILRRLPAQGYLPFEALFTLSHGVSSLIVGFLAVLELVKEHVIEISQHAAMEPIYVCRAGNLPTNLESTTPSDGFELSPAST